MRIAIVAAGGVGGYFGAKLAQAGEDVVFLARGAHLRAIRERGLRVESPDGDLLIHPAHATDDAAEVGPVDVVLVAVKGWQLPQAVATLRPLVGTDTLVVPMMNGVEAPDQLAATLGAEHVAGGLCGLLGEVVGPGHIRNQMALPFVTIGELDNARTPRVERLREAFARAGVQADIADDIRAALWEKLLFVGPLGAVGAATRAPAGVVRRLLETRALLEDAMAEVAAVARADGIAVSDSAVAGALDRVDGLPARATASMQRDILAGRPSELDAQVGAVVRAARAVGVAAPIHSYLYASLLPLERAARDESAPLA